MSKVKNLILYITAASIISCSYSLSKANFYSNKDDDCVTSEDFRIAAHRGFSSIKVENSKEAIEEASSKEYIDYIEIDIRLTSDNEIVLSHDDTLYLTKSNTINISETNKEELESTTFIHKANILSSILNDNLDSYIEKIKRIIKLSNCKYKLCTLEDAIAEAGDKKILLDIKFNDNTTIFSKKILEQLKNIPEDKIVLQSSDIEALSYLRKLAPNYHYQAIISKESSLIYADTFDAVGIRKNIVNYDFVEKEIESGKDVAVWTINTKKDVENIVVNLNELATEIIYITDYPDLIVNELEKAKIKVNN